MTYAFVLFTAFRFGYDAEQNGYLFAYVGVIAIIGQGVLFNRMVGKFGEAKMIVTGCLLMIAAFFAMPYLRPEYGGLGGLLAVCTMMSIGNALASPALTSLVSKISGDHEQGSALGILQSGASLARAIGPMIGGVLLNNALNTIDDRTVTRTFWAAAAIMFVAFLASVYVMRTVREHPAIA